MPAEALNLFGWGLQLTLTQLLVLVAFVGLGLGYLLAVLTNRTRHMREGNSVLEKDRATSNIAFMKGINYILSDKHDRAIEELTRAVSVDTETVETYVALGNLFRRHGDIDRAIRVRQSIIVRPNLDPKSRQQAWFDLGLDYRKGGLTERAVVAFEEVLRLDSNRVEAHLQLAQIYEDTGEWDQAALAMDKAARLTGERAVNVLAHYQVEIGKTAMDQGQPSKAKAAFKKAISLDGNCLDAYLHLGDWLLRQGKPKKALAAWRQAVDVAPHLAFLTFNRLTQVATLLKDLKPIETFLDHCAVIHGIPLAHLALGRVLADRGQTENALILYDRALALDAHLLEAHLEKGRLTLALGRPEEIVAAYKSLLEQLAVTETVFHCGHCGLESRELLWRCPRCYRWDSMTPKSTPISTDPSRTPSPDAPPFPVKETAATT